MFSRQQFIGINYITAQREMNLDASFIYVQGKPGADYYEFDTVCRNEYHVFRIILPEPFPYAPPTLVLASPKVVIGRLNDPPLHQLGCSHDYHLHGVHKDGLNICYASSSWKQNSCVSILILKAYLWISAYDRYLGDGQCIDHHLKKMKDEVEV